ncbi:MAG: hypothetical protein HY553_21345 [Elusimicrobia bacterium]|nr:hypothetical protein [Elusimicrobiota bacterium]
MPGRSWKGHEPKRCERCGEPLRAGDACPCADGRAVAPPASERYAVVEGVEAHVGERVLQGTLVLREEGLFLFFERCEERPSLLVSMSRAVVDKAGGLFGSILIKATDAGGGEDASPPPGVRLREDYRAYYDRALHEASRILHCRWCLPIPRTAIRSAVFRGDGLLEVALPGSEVELWAAFRGTGAFELLAAAGFPVERLGPAVAKKAALAAVGALALWAVLSELSELHRAEQWARPHVKAAAAAAVNTDGELRHVLVRDGKRIYVVGSREIPEGRLSWRQKFWYDYREIMMLLGGVGVGAALGIWATLRKLG